MITVYKVVSEYNGELTSEHVVGVHQVKYRLGETLNHRTPLFVYGSIDTPCTDEDVLECETSQVFYVTPKELLLLTPETLRYYEPAELECFWLRGWYSDLQTHCMTRHWAECLPIPMGARLCFDLTPIRRLRWSSVTNAWEENYDPIG